MIRIRVIGLTRDRRTKDLVCRGAALEQAFADARLEKDWRARVSANVLRRLAQKGAAIHAAPIAPHPIFSRRQAE